MDPKRTGSKRELDPKVGSGVNGTRTSFFKKSDPKKDETRTKNPTL